MKREKVGVAIWEQQDDNNGNALYPDYINVNILFVRVILQEIATGEIR